MSSNDGDFQKEFEYGQVRTDDKNDLRWVHYIIVNLAIEGKVKEMEGFNLIDSLYK